MNPSLIRSLTLPALLLALSLCVWHSPAAAGPGAHGPNGEHLDSPTPAAASGPGAPKLEAQSELFELVARLEGGRLSLLIDRFASNAPVLGAQVDIESGKLKAKASFQTDTGDYVVDDPALLKLLAAPGEHALVITVIAGEDTDLLDGVLRVGAAPADAMHTGGHAHGAPRWLGWAAAAAGAVAVLLAWGWRRRRPGGGAARRLSGEAA